MIIFVNIFISIIIVIFILTIIIIIIVIIIIIIVVDIIISCNLTSKTYPTNNFTEKLIRKYRSIICLQVYELLFYD